jgi:L-ascorbate metabolism protein UlaG (beta-lactamase superfamily)
MEVHAMAKKTHASRRNTTQVTWLGHSAFHIVSPAGKVILIDPWLDNPNAPRGARDINLVDLILVTHGHGDHLGNTVDIGHRTNARVVAIHEVALYLQAQGLSRVEGINKSGSVVLDGITITMTQAEHSGGMEPGGALQIGGDPAGYVIRLENGFAVYHAGDTGVFGDMRLIRELYAPDLAILPIGGYFTMGPVEAAKACELLRPRYIVGMHYGTYPILAGTPGELKKHLPAPLRSRVKILEPGVATKF